MFEIRNDELFIVLVHPGNPHFRNRDEGSWGIPKGLVEADESLLEGAKREFEEETGIISRGPFYALGEVRFSKGKHLHAWAFEMALPEDYVLKSNTFEMEWPLKSNEIKTFPEVDQLRVFPIEIAVKKAHPVQATLILRLKALLEQSKRFETAGLL